MALMLEPSEGGYHLGAFCCTESVHFPFPDLLLSYISDSSGSRKNCLLNHTNVISWPKWRFFDYAEDIETWYRGLSEDGRYTFDSLLKINTKAASPDNWQGSKPLQGACKKFGIWEWRFRSDGVQQRILGVFGSERKTAIFLIGCYHKDNIYKPSDCLETAVTRAKSIKTEDKFNERPIRLDC
jgi:hypothetical protein